MLVNYLSTSLNQPSNDLFKLRQNIKLSSRLRRNSVFYSYAFLFHEFPLYQRASFLSCSKVTCFLAFHDHFVLRLCKNYSLSLWTLIITGFWILKNSKERRERFARYIGWFITSGILFVAEKYSFASIKNPRKQKKKKKKNLVFPRAVVNRLENRRISVSMNLKVGPCDSEATALTSQVLVLCSITLQQ